MDWYNQLGNMATLFPDTPALAWDFALNGPNPNLVGYDLAYELQVTPEPIDVYPSQELPLPEAGI